MLKNWFYGSMFVLVTAQWMGCAGPQGKTGLEDEGNPVAAEASTPAEAAPAQAKEVAAVSIWDQVSVRETPDQKGKWLTSLSIGESLLFLGETQTDATDDNREYMKVRLNDGKEGWTRGDFVVPEAQAAVFTQETFLYKRPDLLTKSENVFSLMDIVAVVETQDDWLKVKGKRTQGKWIEEGWIKASNLSVATVDIATAKFAKLALGKEEDKQKAAIQEIVQNGDLKSSVFIAHLEEMIAEPEVEEVEEYISENADELEEY